MTFLFKLAILLGFLLAPQFVGTASAQSSTTYAAPTMWGTVPGGVGVNGAVDSAVAHNQNGVIAGQVNAAGLGSLFGTGSSSTVYAIGSETIVSSTIYGNGSSSSINSTLSSSNTGSVSNTGQVGQTNAGQTGQTGSGNTTQ